MKMTSRDRFLLIFLAVLLIGVSYYMFFYKPLQAELANIETQCNETDDQITVAMGKASKMKAMQDELDEIFSRPEDEITEIAPFDNAKVVMSQLNGILRNSEEYELNFRDPVVEKDGTVRRVVSMKFSCPDYNSAKAIIDALTASHWRCLINGISLEADEDQNVTEEVTAEGEGTEATENAAQSEAPEASQSGEEGAPAEEPQAMAIVGPVTVSATITFFESTKIAG